MWRLRENAGSTFMYDAGNYVEITNVLKSRFHPFSFNSVSCASVVCNSDLFFF